MNKDLWFEKNQVNQEFLLMAKINKTEKCLELRDRQRGELRADVNIKGENDWTPIHYAAFNGNSKLVSFLLFHEANIDAMTSSYETPLTLSSQK